MANYVVSDASLTAVADAIRSKGGTSAPLAFPDGFAAAIAAIPAGRASWTKVGGTTEFEAVQTSTTGATAATIQCGTDIVNKAKIIYVRVRDKAGPRAGYCAGSDAFFINTNKANGSTSTFATPAVVAHRYTTSSAWATYAGQYGVYGYSISNTGALIIRKRYHSSYSLTVNGTFQADVWILEYPDGYPDVFDS